MFFTGTVTAANFVEFFLMCGVVKSDLASKTCKSSATKISHDLWSITSHYLDLTLTGLYVYLI